MQFEKGRTCIRRKKERCMVCLILNFGYLSLGFIMIAFKQDDSCLVKAISRSTGIRQEKKNYVKIIFAC